MLTEQDLPKRRCVAYCRISTDAQDGGAQLQESTLKDYARRHHIPILEWYSDTQGRNPRGTRNPEFRRMMADAEAGKVDAILVAYVERFGLVNDEIGWFIHEIRDRGVACWAVDLRRDLRDCRVDGDFWKSIADDAARSLKTIQQLGRKQLQRRLTYAQAKKGRWPAGCPPYGIDLCYYSPDGTFLYRVVDNGGRGNDRKRLRINADTTTKPYDGRGNWVPKDKYAECYPHPSEDEGRLNVVRMIFDWADREGLSACQIEGRLNAMGKRTLAGGNWEYSAIRKLLRNSLYIGRLTYFKETAAKYTAFDTDQYIININNQTPKRRPANIDPIQSDEIFPPIVPVEQFNRVQAILDNKKRQKPYADRSADAVFRGLVYCGSCRRKMGYATDHGRYFNYRCGHGGCFMSVDDKIIKAVVTKYLAHTKQNLQGGECPALECELERIKAHAPAIDLRNNSAEIAEIDSAIEQLAAEKEKIAALLVKCPALADTDTYGAELKRVTEEIADLQRRKREQQERLTPEEYASKIEAAENALAEGRQREYSQHLKSVIAKIQVYGRPYGDGEKRPHNRKHEVRAVMISPVAPLAPDLPIDTDPAVWLPERRFDCLQPFTAPPVWMKKGGGFVHDETWIAENDWKDGPLPPDMAEALGRAYLSG